MAKTVSFCVDLNGKRRELFYVTEKQNEGLTLILRHTGFHQGQPVPDPTYVNRAKPSRYSIHTSDSDPIGNLFHRTLITEKITQESYVWTDAIRKKRGFAYLYAKLCCDMDERFAPRTSENVELLGSYDPNEFSLCYMILVSAPEQRFSVYIPESFYFHEYLFKRFRITVLVSFLCLKSEMFEDMLHNRTFREDDPTSPDGSRGHINGLSFRDIITIFTDLKMALFEKRLERVPSEHRALFRAAGAFFAHASKKTVPFHDHAWRVRLLFALNGIGKNPEKSGDEIKRIIAP
jgi:hypothetical protein